MRLHGYFRSSAAWRVRIALALKGLSAESIPHHLRKGEQRDPAYLALNPQGLVPAVELGDGQVLTQSLAIIEWLEETNPHPPLLPEHPLWRARVRAFALAIACEIHPVQNLLVLKRLKRLGLSQDIITEWARATNEDGLRACETLVKNAAGPFCFGNAPSLADICLIPQLGNARRATAWTRPSFRACCGPKPPRLGYPRSPTPPPSGSRTRNNFLPGGRRLGGPHSA